ncbi:MAG: glycoside hydrolase family 27 protein [Bacteroidales bacterium]|nr:glycoside hydrolase family 27 protein [Bacteroidales bacterium]
MKKLILLLLLPLFTTVLYAQKFEDLAQTPPMGWNSWNHFECDHINEQVIRDMADAMVNSGMKEVGYEFIVIDDCWQVGRDAAGKIIVDSVKFPHGMKQLSDYIHSKGLKFGIYSDAGTHTCGGRPGSKGFERQDAESYAQWNVDYLKYDWCNTQGQEQVESYTLMRDELYKAGRPIVFSICDWGESNPWKWAGDIGHLWRTTLDITDRWDGNRWGNQLGWTEILEKQVGLEKYAGPGHWNDPDMLEVGNKGLTINEARAHFSMWCMLAAPLMTGNDLKNMSKEIQEILVNKELIAINQDILGKQGFKIYDEGNFEIWQKPLSNGSIAICFLNLENKEKEYSLNWDKINIKDFNGSYQLKNLWENLIMGNTKNQVLINIPPRDVLVYKLSRME